MSIDLSDDLQDIDDARMINRHNIDAAPLREAIFVDSGSIYAHQYTSFWQVREVNKYQEYGVRFDVRNTLLRVGAHVASTVEKILTPSSLYL